MRSTVQCALALLLLVLAACGQPDARSAASVLPTPTVIAVSTANPAAASAAPSAASAPTLVPTTVHVINDYVYASSFEDMVQQAPIIVIAELIGPTEVINDSRDVNDPTKPATDSFIVAQVYTFHVRRYLKGQGAETINIAQAEGRILGKKAADVTTADIEQARKSYDYMPFRPGVTYLLVLRPLDYLGSNPMYYGGRSVPWRFVLAADGHTTAEGPGGAELGAGFGYNPDIPQLAQIEQLVNAAPSVTPAK